MILKELKSLVKLANDLDSKGLYKEADIIDGVLLKLSQSESRGELHIYDFDGTLFRSPQEPSSWEKDWWADPASLLPPCVPDEPGPEWWIEETVDAARKSISNPAVFSILMTGRKESIMVKGERESLAFRYRVPELLSQVGLNFDRVHLSTGDGENTIKEKIGRALNYLSEYPFIKTVKIWDDRENHLSEFKTALEGQGYVVFTNHVRSKPMEPMCQDSPVKSQVAPKKVSYVGIFLDAPSRGELVNEFGLKHDKIENDHITLSMGLATELKDMIGQKVTAKVVGYSEDEKGQAVVVDLPTDIPYLVGAIPHVTLSHTKDVDPKYSKDLLSKGFKTISGPTISGYIDTYPRSLIQKSASINGSSLTLKDLIKLVKEEDSPDFYFQRQGSSEAIGTVKESLDKVTESWWGVKVKENAKKIIDPKFLYYWLMHIKGQGYWKSLATGTTKLVSIRKDHLLSLPVSFY